MSQLTLRKGSPVEADEVVINNGEVDIVYRPRIMVRSVKKAFTGHGEELARLYARVARAGRDLTDAEEEKAMRLMCNQIGLLVAATAETTEDAGDVLYKGWIEDRVSDDQVTDLYEDLLGIRSDDQEAGESPS